MVWIWGALDGTWVVVGPGPGGELLRVEGAAICVLEGGGIKASSRARLNFKTFFDLRRLLTGAGQNLGELLSGSLVQLGRPHHSESFSTFAPDFFQIFRGFSTVFVFVLLSSCWVTGQDAARHDGQGRWQRCPGGAPESRKSESRGRTESSLKSPTSLMFFGNLGRLYCSFFRYLHVFAHAGPSTSARTTERGGLWTPLTMHFRSNNHPFRGPGVILGGRFGTIWTSWMQEIVLHQPKYPRKWDM